MDVENKELCKYTLKEQELTQLRDAIEDLYYFEFVIGKFASFVLTFAIIMYIFACTPECDEFRRLPHVATVTVVCFIVHEKCIQSTRRFSTEISKIATKVRVLCQY